MIATIIIIIMWIIALPLAFYVGKERGDYDFISPLFGIGIILFTMFLTALIGGILLW